MAQNKLLIVGAGGHGRSVAEAVALAGEYEIAGFLDDGLDVGQGVMSWAVLGRPDAAAALRHVADSVIVAIGNNALREAMTEQLQALGFALATVIHPRAFVAPSAVVGSGSAIMAGAIVGTEAQLGRGVIVNCGAVVDHHAKVHDFGHLGVNACMAGGTVLGRGAWMQAGAAMGYGVELPANAVLQVGGALSATHKN